MLNNKPSSGIRSQIGRVFTLAAAASLGLGGVAIAQTEAANEGGDAVSALVIKASNAGQAAKQTAEPIDQSQTITTVSAQDIGEQNLQSLHDVLTTVTGVTFGAGEGGGGYGDSIILRGYSANNDIQIDGVRDSAQYVRSDQFNTEQVDITNGANSVYSGSGSVGGTINVVTKTPTLRDEVRLGGGAGTDSYGRLTIDANHALTEGIGVRLNAMVHNADIPGRDVETAKRWGFAPSIAFGLDGDTQLTLAYLRQHDENTPFYGVPFFNGAPVPGVSPGSYYGYRNIDTQQSDINAATAVFNHRFSNVMSIRNLTRYQEVSQFTLADPPEAGTYCLANGLAPVRWTQTASAAAGNPITTDLSGYAACASPGVYTVGGPRGTTRQTRNTLTYTQTDLNWKLNTGPVAHTLVAGFSLANETYRLENGNSQRNPLGATPNPTLPTISIYSPQSNNIYTGPLNFIVTGNTDSEINNRALYAFDTLKFGPKFLVNLGARYEEQEGLATTLTYATPYPAPPASPVATVAAPFRNSANLFSYRAGLVYKPAEKASLYISYGNSKTPSQATVNGACTAATCSVQPETALVYEVGGKWDAINGRVSLTAALFRNDRQNYKTPDAGNPANPSATQTLDGKARVEGVALGVNGRVTPKWNIAANYTYLRSKVLSGASAFIAGGGVTGTERDWIKGDPLLQTPKHALSLWTTYRLPHRVQIGYGLTYQGRSALTQHTGVAIAGSSPTRYAGRSTIPLIKSADYTVSRLMVAWQAQNGLGVQLNVQNLFDKEYYTNIRSRQGGAVGASGWATPGPGRSATLTATYRF